MTYFIEQRHTNEECLQSLDELVERSPKLLESCYFDCTSGEHRGYGFVEAKSEFEARDMIPSPLRARSRVTPVAKYTPEQVRSFHR